MTLSKLDEMKITLYKKMLGQLTAAEALEESIHYDEIARSMNPFDPAKTRYVQLSMDLINYAELLEKQNGSQQQ